jgi:two-component system chemotaxis sensor kinase CheA
MADGNSSAALASVRKSIAALSLEAALHDLSTPEGMNTLLPMLAQVGKDAKSAGMPALVAMSSATPGTEKEFLDAISHMQQFVATPAVNPEAKPKAPPEALNQDPELISDFLLESREYLSNVEAQLLVLERNPADMEAINTIFRGFHTIKGLAGFLEFPRIQKFAHEVETLLDLARTSRISVQSDLIDLILQSTDFMNQCLNGVETGHESASDAGPLIARIRSVIDGVAASKGDLPAAAKLAAPPPPVVAAPPIPAVHGAAGRAADLAQLALVVAKPVPPGIPAAGPPSVLSGTVLKPAAVIPAAIAVEPSAVVLPRCVKVDTDKLDYLVEMVGELVIAQSLIQHDPDLAALHNPKLLRNVGHLGRITADVQHVAMAMRMIPIRQLFGRMARLVRDLARKSGKQADLVLTGEDTELDRDMVEELADPLMHMMRNSMDHGAEMPDVRMARGKSPVARLELKAYHKGGFINIEVSDDGQGLMRDKILAKAKERGMISAGEHLSDQEIFKFIFEPGFSTADKVTDVSGRGVGMDVVRKHVAKLRGRIDITSVAGKGTTFVIKLPLTMAIIEGLVVGVGEQRYILPIFMVKEMFRPTADALSTVPDGGEMVMVRGSLLPILRLYRRFGVIPTSEDPTESVLVVVEGGRKNFCVQVDQLIGKQEVVIKSLGETFSNVTGVAGGSILGDGRVGLILDVEGLFGNPARK